MVINLNNIKLIILDVDGTLTDGKIYYDNNGNEMKAFNAKDGMAIAQAIKNGIEIAIITGRKSEIVDRRGKELGIKYIFQGIHRKIEALNELIEELHIINDNVMYIGDDINDLEIMKQVKFAACPFDAVNEVKEICDIISSYTGGNGAVREIIENVLKIQGKWDEIVNIYIGINQ